MSAGELKTIEVRLQWLRERTLLGPHRGELRADAAEVPWMQLGGQKMHRPISASGRQPVELEFPY